VGPLAPLRTRAFRTQWYADLCTAWALEMETLILGWYVLVESGSVLQLTIFGALMYVGTLLSPVLGTLGDRLGLRRVLAGMRMSYGLLACVILLLAATAGLVVQGLPQHLWAEAFPIVAAVAQVLMPGLVYGIGRRCHMAAAQCQQHKAPVLLHHARGIVQ